MSTDLGEGEVKDALMPGPLKGLNGDHFCLEMQEMGQPLPFHYEENHACTAEMCPLYSRGLTESENI